MRKQITFSILLLAGSFLQCAAQENKEFAAFARTKDSLMHIAFYDNNVPAYQQTFNELKARYDKLSTKDKSEFKDYVEEEYYYMARAYAKAGNKGKAIAALESSQNYNYKELQKEKDLNNLRKEPHFITFLTAAKNKKPKYVEILYTEAGYNEKENDQLPSFTYQAEEAPDLALLKKTYNLDSIAGQGNDVSQVINLMKWVHDAVRHNGSSGNPEIKNANSLIRECRNGNKTLNCRGLAIVLNEVYLAKGFPSRFVTCMPKDTTDNDCHVINVVWCSSLKKWVWMDPTFMAYIMNENGDLLSIEEVRKRIIANKTLIINPDANHNRENAQTKSNYLDYYMAKNLYKIECPSSSESNYETWENKIPRKYVQLLPGLTHPAAKVENDHDGVPVYTTYYTNDAGKFWCAPPERLTKKNTAPMHTQAEYEKAIGDFKMYYNKGQYEGIQQVVIDEFKDHWDQKKVDDLSAHFGKIISFTYMGQDDQSDDVALFKMDFEKSVHCMGISLSDNNKIGTFRFKTYSNYIDWRLAKEIEKDRKKM